VDSRNNQEKYLLCRPLGGLNDVLCQVEFARRIAKRTKRKLVVQSETGSPGLKHRFGQQFSELFDFLDKKSISDFSKFKSILMQVSHVYPEVYVSLATWLNKSLEDRTGGEQVQSRLERTPPRNPDVVVHEGFGGGMASFQLLEHLNISSAVLDSAFELKRELPTVCAAIHFRNTDYQSSYAVLKKAIERVESRSAILIATDDDYVVARLRDEYPSREFISAGSIVAQASPKSPVEAAIQEMILLASCSELELIPLDLKGSSVPSFSGFGRLTQHIWTVQKIQRHGMSVLFSEVIKLALESPQRKRNPLRLIVFAAIRATELLAHSYKPRGVYRQLMNNP
jgi:hypothetical protein